MSSHTPIDPIRARKSAAMAASSGVYIDWGPDLPARYPGGRARVLVANPTTIFVGWESDRPAPDRWALHVEIDGGPGFVAEVPGKSPDVWLQVPAGSRGRVHLVRVDAAAVPGDVATLEELAVMPFRTPPAGPSWRTDERWGRLGPRGQMIADVAPPHGERVAVEEPVGMAAVGYEGAADHAGSGSLPGQG